MSGRSIKVGDPMVIPIEEVEYVAKLIEQLSGIEIDY